MDWAYLFLKFLHVTGVIVWVGGMLTLLIINALVGRGGDMAQLAALGQQSEFYGRSVIGPAMAVTLLAGLAAATRVGYPFSSPWIVWGLVGFVGAVALGAIAVPRTARALGDLAGSAGSNDSRVAALGRQLGLLNVLNVLLLLTVVWAMIFKPTL
jgi:uncharacterized membrane protein